LLKKEKGSKYIDFGVTVRDAYDKHGDNR
jgi:hypothetical protein